MSILYRISLKIRWELYIENFIFFAIKSLDIWKSVLYIFIYIFIFYNFIIKYWLLLETRKVTRLYNNNNNNIVYIKVQDEFHNDNILFLVNKYLRTS